MDNNDIGGRRSDYRSAANMMSPSHRDQLQDALPGLHEITDDHRYLLDPTLLIASGIATANAMTKLRLRLGVTDEMHDSAIEQIGSILLSGEATS